jgi:hypothetical protein
MRGRVDSEPEAVNPMPHGKRKFLSIPGMTGTVASRTTS